MAVLMDSSGAIALNVDGDKYHQLATTALRRLRREPILVVAPALTEIFHVIRVRTYHSAAIAALRSVRSAFEVYHLSDREMDTAEHILQVYRERQLDYVDACILAVAEHQRIPRIFTFDRDDFPVYQPRNLPYLELIPDLTGRA